MDAVRGVSREVLLKRTLHVLDFLATWPIRYVVNTSLLIIAISIVAMMLPRSAKTAISQPAVNLSSSRNIVAIAQRVADAHLFGQLPMQDGNGPAAPAMNIKVEGLLYSDDQTSALAILEVDGNSSAFKVGDTLADGERLTAIAPTAIQLTQGMVQRVLEMPEQFGGPGDGISLGGDTGLIAKAPFPGLAAPASAQVYKPALRAVSVPQSANPLDQLRALRQQLISDHPAGASSPHPAKHPAKP